MASTLLPLVFKIFIHCIPLHRHRCFALALPLLAASKPEKKTIFDADFLFGFCLVGVCEKLM
jgi:hypothetical protein